MKATPNTFFFEKRGIAQEIPICFIWSLIDFTWTKTESGPKMFCDYQAQAGTRPISSVLWSPGQTRPNSAHMCRYILLTPEATVFSFMKNSAVYFRSATLYETQKLITLFTKAWYFIITTEPAESSPNLHIQFSIASVKWHFPSARIVYTFLISTGRKDERWFWLRVRAGNSPQTEAAQKPHDIHRAAAGWAGEGVRTDAVSWYIHAGGAGSAYETHGGQDTGVVQQPPGSAAQAAVEQFQQLRVHGPVHVLPGIIGFLHAAWSSLCIHFHPE